MQVEEKKLANIMNELTKLTNGKAKIEDDWDKYEGYITITWK